MMFQLIAVLACVGGAVSANTRQLVPMNAGNNGRIINGSPASINAHPHQLKLVYNGNFRCGASIIHNDWALTAAHCVDGITANGLSVESDLGFAISIQSVIMHDYYNVGDGSFPNDIAVLKLAPHSYDISGWAIPVTSGSNDYADTICTISGYGVTESGSAADRLMAADVRVLSETECEGEWGADSILPQHICVQGEGFSSSGSCNGDSGGPLTCGGKLAGVTSWGVAGCHFLGIVFQPSVYVRTSFFYDWIRVNCDYCI